MEGEGDCLFHADGGALRIDVADFLEAKALEPDGFDETWLQEAEKLRPQVLGEATTQSLPTPSWRRCGWSSTPITPALPRPPIDRRRNPCRLPRSWPLRRIDALGECCRSRGPEASLGKPAMVSTFVRLLSCCKFPAVRLWVEQTICCHPFLFGIRARQNAETNLPQTRSYTN